MDVRPWGNVHIVSYMDGGGLVTRSSSSWLRDMFVKYPVLTVFVDGYQPSITCPLGFFDVYIQI